MRVRFLAHDASRTGAPLVLLTFLRWLREHAEVEADLVCWRGGPLVPDFEALVPTMVVHRDLWGRTAGETIALGLRELRLHPLARTYERLVVDRRLPADEVDLVYCNGAGSAVLLHHLPESSTPRLVHLHELRTGVERSVPADLAGRFLPGATRVVAVADLVAEVAVTELGVPRDRVAVVPGCLPWHPPADTVAPDVECPLVGSVGAGSRRKGVDLFVPVARAVANRQPGDLAFAWVGRLDDPAEVAADVEAARLTVHRPGEVADPRPWLERMDVYVSTAREDPFPLATLEAMAAGVPVVSFDNGGMADLLRAHDQAVVAPLDIGAMAEAVGRALDPSRPQAGRAEEVRAEFAVERIGPRLVEQMEQAVG
jgi:glycosyltransferase involved in cell wall biosynthesis